MTMAQTTEDRIERLESSVDRIEDRIAADISKIFSKLDSLSETITKSSVEAAKNHCPSPGACINIAENLKHTVDAHNATMLRVERLELKILDLDRDMIKSFHRIDGQFHGIEKQKSWVLGVWSAIAFFAAIIGTVTTIIISHFISKL